jgi:MYXO-CTERM domain-containing protein
MKRFNTVAASAAALALAGAGEARAVAVEYDGILFPQGDVSFADFVVSADTGAGTTIPATSTAGDPDEALGPPDYADDTDFGFYTLGVGGSITLQFVDNALSGSGDSSPDLHVFEIGPDVEDTFVEISVDGSPGSFFAIGKVFGSTSSLDIDAALALQGLDPFTPISFVRLIDDAAEGQSNPSADFAGADIDAVGAIRSVAPPPPPTPNGEVPLPGALPLLGLGAAALVALRRRR